MSKESVENIELTVITPHSILHFVPGDLAVAVDGCHRVGDHHADKLLVVNATRLVHVADGEDLVDLSVAELAHYLHLHLDKDHPVVHSVVNTMPKMATEKWLLTAP